MRLRSVATGAAVFRAAASRFESSNVTTSALAAHTQKISLDNAASTAVHRFVCLDWATGPSDLREFAPPTRTYLLRTPALTGPSV